MNGVIRPVRPVRNAKIVTKKCRQTLSCCFYFV
jgi:hypothetical protein